MPTNAQLKQRSREALSGKFLRVALMFAFVTAFEEAFGLKLITEVFFSLEHQFPFTLYGYNYIYSFIEPVGLGRVFLIIAIVMGLVALVCKVGEIRAAHKLLNGGDPTLGTFFPFRLVGKVILMNLLRALLILAWTFVFIFPGFIAAFRYSMADHLLAEDPNLSAVEALRESRIRMHGYKMSLFSLKFSFIVWIVLVMLLESGLGLLCDVLHAGFAGELIVEIVMWVAGAFLTAYMETATTAFYEAIPEPGAAGYKSAETEETDVDREFEKDAENGEEVAPEVEKPDPLVRAKELFLMYKCSKKLMAQAGVLTEYETTGASDFNEDVWRRGYAQELMRRFDRDPEALDDLLSLSAEYSMDDLLDRVIERIGRHLREESLSAAETLNLLGRAVTALSSPAFEDAAGFVGRKKAQIGDLAQRLETRLRSEDESESWRDAFEAVRAMCR